MKKLLCFVMIIVVMPSFSGCASFRSRREHIKRAPIPDAEFMRRVRAGDQELLIEGLQAQRDNKQRLPAGWEEELTLEEITFLRDTIRELLVRMGRLQVGMTEEQVRRSWGLPTDINTTVSRYGTHEQWVYRRRSDTSYVYFEDGILTTIQY